MNERIVKGIDEERKRGLGRKIDDWKGKEEEREGSGREEERRIDRSEEKKRRV